MRFTVTGEWSRNDLLRLILGMFLVYVFFFWITNWMLWFQRMSLDPASVAHYYLGDPAAEFGRPARPVAAMTEVAHGHLFTMGLLVMTLTHLLLFLPMPVRWKATIVGVAFASALLDEGGGWLVRFVHPGFAVLKVGGFLLLQTSLLGLMIASAIGVIRPGRNAFADGERSRRSPSTS